MEFNQPKCVSEFAEIGRAIGLTGSDDEISRRLIDEVATLFKSVGILQTLRELGLAEDRQTDAYERDGCFKAAQQQSLSIGHRVHENNHRSGFLWRSRRVGLLGER